MAKGKYQQWLTDDGLLRLEGWARDGLNDKQIAKNVGINEGTLYDWMNKYPKISEAIKRGKAPVDIEVENALLKRAKGYSYEEKTTEIRTLADGDRETHIKTIIKHVPPDPTAIIFWLKNRKPEVWNKPQEEPSKSGEGVKVVIDV